MTDKKPKTKRNTIVTMIVSLLVGLGLGVASQKTGLDLKPAQPAVEEAVNQTIDGAVDAARKAGDKK
jgi:capsular polysaccharide biosynthesis protein